MNIFEEKNVFLKVFLNKLNFKKMVVAVLSIVTIIHILDKMTTIAIAYISYK